MGNPSDGVSGHRDIRYFDPAAKKRLQEYRGKIPSPALASGRRSPRALEDAAGAAGAKKLPSDLLKKAKKGQTSVPKY